MKKSLFDTASERLNAYVTQNKLRYSPVRLAVLEQACLFPAPFTAEQLKQACEAQNISKATVYNTLNLCIDAQIVHATNRQRGRTNIEYEVTAGNQIRMQIICQKCGRVASFRDKAIERLVQGRRCSNFYKQHFSLFIYGECRICSNKPKQE